MGSRQTAHQTAQPRSRESRILTEQSESEFAICAVELDQALGGGVLGGEGVVVLGDGRGDLLGKLLAELDAPLVVGVEAPHGTLNEGDVLVQGDELAKQITPAISQDDDALAAQDASTQSLIKFYRANREF